MRLLGKHSPIVDIEHLQIFSPKSLNYALRKFGYRSASVQSFADRYPLHYWTKMLPLPAALKRPLYDAIHTGQARRLGQSALNPHVGNILAWAPSGHPHDAMPGERA